MAVSVVQDARYALRSLWRAPGFTLVALITLALGIGGTTAIFSVVDGILLRPLPYPHPEAIVRLSRGEDGNGAFSAADFLDYKHASRSFQSVAGYRPDAVDLTGRGEPVRLVSFETTAAFFDAIGLPALAGRTYTEKIDLPSGPRVAVLSEGVWTTHFGRAPDVVGSTIRLNRIAFTVLGIMPATLVHPDNPDLWVLAPQAVPTSPIPVDGDAIANREVNYFQAIARLTPDVTLAQANAELRSVAERLAREHPDTNEGETASVTPLQESLVGDVRDALLVLLGAVGFVLLIACANVASLLLARGTGRRRELSVRSALGASRGRLLGQLLTESLVLAVAGGALGLLVAYWGIALLLAVAPDSIPRIDEVRLDPRVAVFGILVSALVGVLFGLAPAFQAARANMVEALKDGGRSGTSRTGLRSGLVVAEIALSLMLLIGAGLMLTSFTRLRGVDPGFVVNSLVVVSLPLPQARYDNTAQARFYEQLCERVTANSVTSRAALIFPQPFGGANAAAGYQIEGAAPRVRSERTVAQLNSVSPGYFQTMGIPLLRGRDLSFADKRDGQAVVVINRTLAEREWPGQDPVGKRLVIGGSTDDPNAWLTVVGVVADSKRANLQAEAEPALYLALPQFVLPYMSVVVRTDAGEAAVARAVKAAVNAIDPELPIDEVRTIEQVLARATGQPRFRAVLVTAFAGVALLLAAVGLYGLISYSVAQRVPEIGIRLALGAKPAQVAGLVLGHGLKLALAGIGIGLAGAAGMARLLEGLLFSISATDPFVYASLAMLLLGITALACYVPARRAMRVDPMTALRAE